MRYSAEAITGAGSTTLPIISLYAPAGNRVILREIGVFNTTATAARLIVCRLTTAGTQGATITANLFDPGGPAATGTAKQTHTVAPTLGALIAACPIGGAIGAGTILTWYGENNGLIIPAGTANGIGIIVASGAGQIADAYLVWDE